MPRLTGETADYLAGEMGEALRAGIWGWHDDDIAFIDQWGFSVGSIEDPVAIWQGGGDRFVPSDHGRWPAANIPGARAHLLADEGHLSLPARHHPELLDELLAVAKDTAT